jgi:hypothetical protein
MAGNRTHTCLLVCLVGTLETLQSAKYSVNSLLCSLYRRQERAAGPLELVSREACRNAALAGTALSG